jgi:hypothetical protein
MLTKRSIERQTPIFHHASQNSCPPSHNSNSNLQCKLRTWHDFDVTFTLFTIHVISFIHSARLRIVHKSILAFPCPRIASFLIQEVFDFLNLHNLNYHLNHPLPSRPFQQWTILINFSLHLGLFSAKTPLSHFGEQSFTSWIAIVQRNSFPSHAMF